MSKHTPGPWEYCCNGMLEPPTVALKQNPKMQIAEITSSDADARLIAAAPEMFELLKAVLTNRRLLNDKYFSSLADRLFNQIETAIAKAEGKE